MRLSWNEIRPRAAEFGREWADAGYEKGETQSFYNAFFRIFGVERRSVARYEEHVKRLDDSQGFIDLFWPGVLLVEQKSAGRDLTAARRQALSYFDALKEHERPRYLLLCDFQNFELLDLGGWLARLFQTLNTPEDSRQETLDEDLARFSYVNGDLFAETLSIPEFDSDMRAALLDACRFDWTAISPAIFGTLFQSVMEPAEQRIKGSH